jgi:hypothetical protein
MEHIRWSSVECIIGLNLLARTILTYPINCVETTNKSGLNLHGRAEGDLVNGGGVAMWRLRHLQVVGQLTCCINSVCWLADARGDWFCLQ